MASRNKRMAAKSKRGKMRSKARKKAVARAAPRKKKATPKKRTIKRAVRKPVSRRPKYGQQSRRSAPVVKDTIVDVVDEPVPGIVRVTEIEEVSVAVPDSGELDEEE